jgi:hypothetical protein
MKKKLLLCKNDDYNGSICPRNLTKQNFIEFPAYGFAIEGIPSNCDTCGTELSLEILEIKKPLNIKLIGTIAGGVFIIGAAAYFFVSPGTTEDGEEVVQTEIAQEEPIPIVPSVNEEPEPEISTELGPEPEKVGEPAPAAKPQPKPEAGSAIKGTLTLNLDGNTYKGEVQNGKAYGLGTLYYLKSTQISPKDLKKRMAEAGDYVTGEFYDGALVQGKLFDKNNELKEIITIGR